MNEILRGSITRLVTDGRLRWRRETIGITFSLHRTRKDAIKQERRVEKNRLRIRAERIDTGRNAPPPFSRASDIDWDTFAANAEMYVD